MAGTASNTELPGTVVLITKDSLGPDWHGKTVSVLWRTWFAASTHPILLRTDPQTLRFRTALFWLYTVLFLTIRFARSSSCRGPGFEPCSGWTLVIPLERWGRWNTSTTPRRTLMEHNTTPHTYGAQHHATHLYVFATTRCLICEIHHWETRALLSNTVTRAISSLLGFCRVSNP
jgi:hypothetical protein